MKTQRKWARSPWWTFLGLAVILTLSTTEGRASQRGSSAYIQAYQSISTPSARPSLVNWFGLRLRAERKIAKMSQRKMGSDDPSAATVLAQKLNFQDSFPLSPQAPVDAQEPFLNWKSLVREFFSVGDRGEQTASIVESFGEGMGTWMDGGGLGEAFVDGLNAKVTTGSSWGAIQHKALMVNPQEHIAKMRALRTRTAAESYRSQARQFLHEGHHEQAEAYHTLASLLNTAAHHEITGHSGERALCIACAAHFSQKALTRPSTPRNRLQKRAFSPRR